MTAAVQEFEKFKQQILEKGIEQGEGRGVARTILRVLASRGLLVSEQVRQRVLSCTDGDLLDRWSDRAALVSSAEDLFA